MDQVEILESEIKKKIFLIQKHLLKSSSVDRQILENIPKYLDSISSLEKENAKLKAQCDKIGEEHSHDLRHLDKLVNGLSKLLENNHA
tara:strand:+ start:1794 stop:2057 length:264 start_codon:yes stop_codon:yes gene_type:complete